MSAKSGARYYNENYERIGKQTRHLFYTLPNILCRMVEAGYREELRTNPPGRQVP